MSNGYVLGIDVGTTRTAAAITRPGMRAGVAEPVALGDRSSAVPSVLYIADDGSVIVGEAAERRAATEPAHVVREFKRRIGDPTPVVVAGRAWAPEELSARLTRWVIDRTARREGGPAGRIAVTHPASWGKHKLDMFGAALARQGLPVSFLSEPQAAALHYAAVERVEPGSTIAVYDFGGGTVDVTIVGKDPSGTFGLVGRPDGVERLGGIDFDEVVFEHVRERMPDAFIGLDENDPAALAAVAAVRRACAAAKEALSRQTEVAVPVRLPRAGGSVHLRRVEFEAMIRPRVEETLDALRRAIASAGLTPEQLTSVLLVGGSSRIPLVAQLMAEQLGRPVAVDAEPEYAVAKGAALSLAPVSAGNTALLALGAAGPPALRPAVPPPSAPPPPPPRPQGFPARPAVDHDEADTDQETRRGRHPSPLVIGGLAAAAAAVVATVAFAMTPSAPPALPATPAATESATPPATTALPAPPSTQPITPPSRDTRAPQQPARPPASGPPVAPPRPAATAPPTATVPSAPIPRSTPPGATPSSPTTAQQPPSLLGGLFS